MNGDHPTEEPDFTFERSCPAPGWTEIRIVTQMPGEQEAYKLTGTAARQRIARYGLATAAGLLAAVGLRELAEAIDVAATHVDRAYALELEQEESQN